MQYFISYKAWTYTGKSPGNFHGRCSMEVKSGIIGMDDIRRIEEIINEENGNVYSVVCVMNWQKFEEEISL